MLGTRASKEKVFGRRDGPAGSRLAKERRSATKLRSRGQSGLLIHGVPGEEIDGERSGEPVEVGRPFPCRATPAEAECLALVCDAQDRYQPIVDLGAEVLHKRSFDTGRTRRSGSPDLQPIVRTGSVRRRALRSTRKTWFAVDVGSHMSEATDVVDEPQHDRFRYTEDGVDAQLLYRAEGGKLILVHTEVPDALGGRGIGGRLVRAAAERPNGRAKRFCRGARTPGSGSRTTKTPSPACRSIGRPNRVRGPRSERRRLRPGDVDGRAYLLVVCRLPRRAFADFIASACM